MPAPTMQLVKEGQLVGARFLVSGKRLGEGTFSEVCTTVRASGARPQLAHTSFMQSYA